MLARINQLQTEIDKLRPLSPENERKIEKKFRLEFNYNSNHIEGNTLTYSETQLLLIFEDTKGNHNIREYDEMRGNDVAYHLIQDWAKEAERPLMEIDVKQLNKTILVRPYWGDAVTEEGQRTKKLINIGIYKESPNSVRLPNGETFYYPSPTDTPILMEKLMQWYQNEIESNELHPVILAALFHYKFVCIHPFDDGNGRISRLLMNYVLLKNNLPPIIIKSADKPNYLRALNQADAGDLDAFVKYIAEQLIWSLQITLDGAEGNLDELDDVDKEITLFKKSLLGEPEKIELNNENKSEIFDKLIKPLFEIIFQKLETFDELFLKKDLWSALKRTARSWNGIKDKEDLYQTLTRYFQINNVFVLRYELITFKKSTKLDFNIILFVELSFKDWFLSIDSFLEGKILPNSILTDSILENSNKYPIYYHQSPPYDEYQKIANALAKNVLEQIKTHLKEEQNKSIE